MLTNLAKNIDKKRATQNLHRSVFFMDRKII